MSVAAGIDEIVGTVTVRGMDRVNESAYVHSTGRRAAAQRCGGHFANWEAVCRLVDHTLVNSDVTVAFFESDPENIVGWAAFANDNAVEWLYLRRSLEEAKIETSAGVLKALLTRCGQVVIMRRSPVRRIMDAIVTAGLTPSVVPVTL